MFEIVYDPWDGEALTDEQAFMFGPTLVRDLLKHGEKEIVVRTISSFLAIDSIRLEIKKGNLQSPQDIIVVWENEEVPINSDGMINRWNTYFGNWLDLLWSELFDFS